MSDYKSNDETPFSLGLLVLPHMYRNLFMEQLEMHKAVESTFENHNNSIGVEIESKPADEQDSYLDLVAYQLHQNDSIFPQLHRRSTILGAYGLLEHRLLEICLSLGQETKTNILVTDIAGTGVHRSTLWLRKVLNFRLEKINAVHEMIRNTNRLRNTLIHGGGFTSPDKNNKLNQFISSSSSLSGDPGNEVVISEEFVGLFIDSICSYFDWIGSEMQNYMDIHYRKS